MSWGKALRAIWNGPFHAGPLVRPVAVGDVLLTLFQTLWRGVVLIGVAVGGLLIYIWLNTEESLTNKVRITANVDTRACSDQRYPLLITFHNDSRRTIRSVSFQVVAQQASRSSDLVNGYPSYSSDFIIPPKTLMSGCWRLPPLKPVAAGAVISYSAKPLYASEDPPTTY